MNTTKSSGFYRLTEIIGDSKARPKIPSLIPLGRSTWLNGVKAGIYPQPVKLSARTVAWKAEDINKLITQLGG